MKSNHRRLLRMLTLLLILTLLPMGLLTACQTPDVPDDPLPDDPLPDDPLPDDPSQDDPSQDDPTVDPNAAATLSEREVEVVEGSAIHENIYGRAPYGLTEVVNDYMTVYGPLLMNGTVNTFQTQSDYSSTHHVNAEGVSVFSDSPYEVKSIITDWKRQDDVYSLSFMTVINRCVFSDYERWCEENGRMDTPPSDDIQLQANGNYKGKTDGATMYMVPTERWIDFVWDTIETAMDLADFEYIMPEEPDVFSNTGYSPAFKAEWQAYYGEPWVAPSTSPEAMLKAQELKVYLIQRAYTVLSERIKQKNPDTKLCIATHSTLSYNTSNTKIAAGLATYLSSGIYDALNAQTWSDTIGTDLTVNGEKIKDFFVAGYLGYASYVDAAGDLPLYAATDALGDGAAKSFLSEDFYYDRYYAQLVTQLLQPEINRFSVVCWPGRSFDPASQDYRIVQQSAAAAVREASGKETTVSAGTPGITYLLSDSLTWQLEEQGWCLSTHDGVLGVTYPLVSDGIPLKIGAMDMVDSADDLDGVNLLIVSFDCQKPQSEEVVRAIADWVKGGGQLLYVGGRDRYDEIESMWWAKYGSPLQALLDMLELDVEVKALHSVGDGTLEWLGSKKQKAIAATGLAASYLNYTVTFEGDVDNILTLSDGATVGFEANVGDGRVVVLGTPSALYAQNANGSEAMRTLVEYACTEAQYEYDSTRLVWSKRGNIVAVHSFETQNMLTGRYINLLDPMMTIYTHYILEANESALLYDINDLDLSVPRLAFTGGELTKLEETAETTTVKVRSAQGAYVAMRLFCAEGLYPQSVKVTKGRVEEDCDWAWSAKDGSLYIRFKGDSKSGMTVTVSWGTDAVEDRNVPTIKERQEEELLARGFELLNPDVSAWEHLSKHTFMINETTGDIDKAFIYKNTGLLSSYGRYCDKENELIYRFDLTAYPELVAVMKICSNYLVQVSTDGENWTTVQDYVEVNGARMQGTSNAATVAIDSTKHAPGAQAMYVRLACADGGNWGGCIVQLDLYFRAVDIPETPVEDYETDQFDEAYYQTDSYQVKWAMIAGQEEADPDAEFIVVDTSVPSDVKIGKTCDRAKEIVYSFDLTTYPNAVVVLDVCQNYLIQVSRDGMSWITVRNSELALGQKVGYKGGASVVGISADKWLSGADRMYVRVADADASDGYGAVLSQLTLYHTGDGESTGSVVATTPEPEPPAPPKPSTDHYLPVTDVTGKVVDESYLAEYDEKYDSYQKETYRISGDTPDDVTGFEVRNTSMVNPKVGLYCDHGREVVYRIDLTQYQNAVLVMAIGQNYCLQISTDDVTYETVQDYLNVVGSRTKDSRFRHAVVIDTALYADGGDVLYVRLGGSENKGGYGGVLEHFAIYYQ